MAGPSKNGSVWILSSNSHPFTLLATASSRLKDTPYLQGVTLKAEGKTLGLKNQTVWILH